VENDLSLVHEREREWVHRDQQLVKHPSTTIETPSATPNPSWMIAPNPPPTTPMATMVEQNPRSRPSCRLDALIIAGCVRERGSDKGNSGALVRRVMVRGDVLMRERIRIPTSRSSNGSTLIKNSHCRIDKVCYCSTQQAEDFFGGYRSCG